MPAATAATKHAGRPIAAAAGRPKATAARPARAAAPARKPPAAPRRAEAPAGLKAAAAAAAAAAVTAAAAAREAAAARRKAGRVVGARRQAHRLLRRLRHVQAVRAGLAVQAQRALPRDDLAQPRAPRDAPAPSARAVWLGARARCSGRRGPLGSAMRTAPTARDLTPWSETGSATGPKACTAGPATACGALRAWGRARRASRARPPRPAARPGWPRWGSCAAAPPATCAAAALSGARVGVAHAADSTS